MPSCFFIGHADADDSIFPALYETVEKHIIDYSVTEFIVGSYGNFDHLAAKAVSRLKQTYAVRLLLLLGNPRR